MLRLIAPKEWENIFDNGSSMAKSVEKQKMNQHADAKSSTETLPVTYVALLRGINVGGNNKVEMAKLKQTFERLGFASVKTFIASGNVVFRTEEQDAAKLIQRIESAIKADFGMHIKVVLRDQRSMSKLVKAIPTSWVNDKEMKCDVMFLREEVDNKTVLKQLPFDPAIEDVKYVPGAVIWRIDRDKAARSRMFKIVGTKLHEQMTVRNPNTVRKLYELMVQL
jgi:uncharacterized protein (DUF1697 family)